MIQKPAITFADAQRIMAAATAEARANQWNVCIAILDEGGHPMMVHRLDGASLSTAYMAVEKARTAVLGKRETKVYEDIIANGRVAFLSAPVMQGLLEGGVPIMADGFCVGSVGVSGVKSEQDAQIAKAGIAAL